MLHLRDHGDGTKTVSFMPSPRMSTYLLAFVVGEFDFVSALTKNGVTIRVFCPPGKPQLGRFALLRAKSKAPPGFLRDKARILRDLRTEPAFA